MKRPETPAQLKAFNDYYEMGPGRSIRALHAVYVKRARTDGRESVPSTRLPTLELWSRERDWVERCISRTQREADVAECRAADELATNRRARLNSARALRAASGGLVAHILNGLHKAGSLPLLATTTTSEDGTTTRTKGLLDYMGVISRSLSVAQQMEVQETGESDKARLQAFIDALTEDMTPEERASIRETFSKFSK